MAGDELVVRGVDGRRTKVVVEHPHRIFADHHVGPDRRRRRQHRAGPQDAVFAQDGHRRTVDRVGSLRASEMGAFVLLVEQRELRRTLRQTGVELLQTDDVGVLFGDQLQDVIDAAAAVLAVETADVVGHHPERPAVINRLFGVAAADFGPPEERNLEKPRHDDRQHHQGAHRAPADHPIEHQHHRGDVDAGGRKP